LQQYGNTGLVVDERSGAGCKPGGSAKVVDVVVDQLKVRGPHVFGGVNSESGDADVHKCVEVGDDFTAYVSAAELQVQQ